MAAETGKRFNRLAVGIAATMLGYMCAAAKPVDVTFLMCYRPDHPEDPSTKQILRFTAAHPEIRPLQWGGLTLPGDSSPSPSRSVPNTASTQLDGVAAKASENDTRLVAMSTDGIGMFVTTSVSANVDTGNGGIVALRANAAKATAMSKMVMCPLMGMETL